jgi:hypothetical protein
VALRFYASDVRHEHLNIAVTAEMAWSGSLVYVVDAWVTDVDRGKNSCRGGAKASDDWNESRDLVLQRMFCKNLTVFADAVGSSCRFTVSDSLKHALRHSLLKRVWAKLFLLLHHSVFSKVAMTLKSGYGLSVDTREDRRRLTPRRDPCGLFLAEAAVLAIPDDR